MGHLDVSGIAFSLPDGRPLLADVTFRAGAGQVTALIGPNGTGKTTLMRIITGQLEPEDGAVTSSGELAVMPQFVGSVRDSSTVRDLLLSVSPPQVRAAATAIDEAELVPDRRRRRGQMPSATRMPCPTGATCTVTTGKPGTTSRVSPHSGCPTTGRSTGR